MEDGGKLKGHYTLDKQRELINTAQVSQAAKIGLELSLSDSPPLFLHSSSFIWQNLTRVFNLDEPGPGLPL